jgi:hypothetical protein
MKYFNIRNTPMEGYSAAKVEGVPGTRYVKLLTEEELKAGELPTITFGQLTKIKDKHRKVKPAEGDYTEVKVKGSKETWWVPTTAQKEKAEETYLTPFEQSIVKEIGNMKSLGKTLAEVNFQLNDSVAKGEISYKQYNRLQQIAKSYYAGEVDPATAAILEKLKVK